MSPENEAKLYQKYPKIFVQRKLPMQKTAMCWGIGGGDGWYDLIDTLCNSLQWDTDKNGYPQVEAVQVKEKFGTLRFYTAGHNDTQEGMIRFAEAMSAKTCETCGAPGRVKGDRWLKCGCDEH